ncbi:hypothetical protein [Niallia circulans]|uniref:hypothetical protein n=1 Tax=Niallia circulans TaxID=1397 RepID=UPI00155F868C|nr:hypothetical protein [Niallia circulans]NRG30722.1 hypothetical protein [Niallia circulans]
MAKEQPKVRIIDGKQYVEVERKAEVGENVVITKLVNGGEASFTIGNIYKVIYNEEDFLDVKDDDGDLAGILHDEYRVLEPIETEEELVTASADNPDQIIELLGNLARRVTKMETELASVKNTANKALSATGNHGEWLIRNQERLVALESDEPIFTTKQVAEIIKALGGGAND